MKLTLSLSSDSCRDGSGILSQRTSQCGEQFPGLPFCIFDEDSKYQLCSAVPILPPPPVQCTDSDSDFLWSKKQCLNSTHTLYRSGRCVKGHHHAKVAKVESCRGYCHQCSNSTVACSLSDDPQIACIPQTENAECPVTGTASFTEDCVDESTSVQTTQKCSGFQIQTNKKEQDCATKFFDTPRCLACNSASFCVAEGEVTCATFGSVPLVTGSPEAGARDGVKCPASNIKMNYYQELCYNSTHVRLLQGDCSNGNKLKSQSTLISCTNYGEDDSRAFCHECGVSVSCSNHAERELACERPFPDRTCNDDTSDLRGLFGCLNEEIFFTEFATCGGGLYSSEMNGFRCANTFEGSKYCNTCGSLNLCLDQKRACSDLGL